MSYIELKSGTDIRGVASDLGGKTVNLTEQAVYDITAAFIVWYINKYEKNSAEMNVAVGHDSRITGKKIAKKVKEALINAGVSVIDCGLASTPAMFMTTVDLKADAAIQITASHHPFDRNGLKFFTPEGGLDSSDITEIVKLADNGEEIICNRAGVTMLYDYMSKYAARLRKMICDAAGKSEEEKPLKGYKIVVDAGNGAGGFYATEVLEKLGADITGSQFLEPDGMFPNHIPNPENKQAMESICEAVKKNHADIGIIFDTDVDRAGCVENNGEEINRNRLVALASYIALEGHDGGVIVTDSVTSDGLKEYIESIGGEHYRFKRGYRNVINKQIELNKAGKFCPLAMETSGHAAFKENYYLDDGAYLMTKIVILLARDKSGEAIKSILAPLKQPVEAKELRFSIKCDDFRAYGERIIEELEKYYSGKDGWTIADDNREGMRISADKDNGNGWLLLRLSVHDPVMPFNMESNEKGGVKKIAVSFYEFIKQFDKLDISPIENFLSE